VRALIDAGAFPAISAAIAWAFSRGGASPVRITTPVSMSSGPDARRPIGVVDDGAEPGLVDALLARIGGERDRRLKTASRATPRSSGW